MIESLARAKKHENYAAAFGGHLFYYLFLQGGGASPPLVSLDPLLPGSANDNDMKSKRKLLCLSHGNV